MTETKWTKGPWTTDESEHDAPYEDILIRASKHHTICTIWIDDKPVHDFNSQQQANAQLMVAAPDLYAATDWVDSKLQTFWSPDMDDLDEVDVTLTYREIRALINARRKARGE